MSDPRVGYISYGLPEGTQLLEGYGYFIKVSTTKRGGIYGYQVSPGNPIGSWQATIDKHKEYLLNAGNNRITLVADPEVVVHVEVWLVKLLYSTIFPDAYRVSQISAEDFVFPIEAASLADLNEAGRNAPTAASASQIRAVARQQGYKQVDVTWTAQENVVRYKTTFIIAGYDNYVLYTGPERIEETLFFPSGATVHQVTEATLENDSVITQQKDFTVP